MSMLLLEQMPFGVIRSLYYGSILGVADNGSFPCISPFRSSIFA